MVLICRQVKTEEIKINHILENGELESNYDAEKRLMKAMKIPEATLFDKRETLISQAYDIQSEKIAFVLSEKGQD